MTPRKVSVLIPTYKFARYLPEAIESVLAQDYPNFELLISDDCSQDGSAEIIARYAANDPRIRVQIHSSNLGMVKNWNWCLDHSDGEFIKFVFGDDNLASLGALTKMVQMLEADDGVTMAVSARNIIDETSQILRVRNNLGQKAVYPGTDVIIRCLEKNVNLVGEPSVVLFRRRDAARGFDTRYRQLPDLEMWFHLLEKGNLAFTPEPLCSFRKHSLQQTEVNRSGRFDRKEHLIMLREYHARPWLRTRASQLLLFTQIYALRKEWKHQQPDISLLEMERQLLSRLGQGRYTLFWLRHKLVRPIANLNRDFRKYVLGQRGL